MFWTGSFDFTLCEESSGRPVLSVEFDGMGDGFSRDGSYVIGPSAYLKGYDLEKRSLKMNTKLRFAKEAGYPLIVVSSPEVEELAGEEMAMALNAVLGEVLTRMRFLEVAKELANDGILQAEARKARRGLDKVQTGYGMLISTGYSVFIDEKHEDFTDDIDSRLESYREAVLNKVYRTARKRHNLLHRESSRLESQLRKAGVEVRRYPPKCEWLPLTLGLNDHDILLPDEKDACRARVAIDLPDGPINKEAVVANFGQHDAIEDDSIDDKEFRCLLLEILDPHGETGLGAEDMYDESGFGSFDPGRLAQVCAIDIATYLALREACRTYLRRSKG